MADCRFDITVDKNNPNVFNVVDKITGYLASVETSVSDDNNDIVIYVSRLDRPVLITIEEKRKDEEQWILMYRALMHYMLFGKEQCHAEQKDTSVDESEQHGRKARPDYRSYT